MALLGAFILWSIRDLKRDMRDLRSDMRDNHQELKDLLQAHRHLEHGQAVFQIAPDTGD